MNEKENKNNKTNSKDNKNKTDKYKEIKENKDQKDTSSPLNLLLIVTFTVVYLATVYLLFSKHKVRFEQELKRKAKLINELENLEEKMLKETIKSPNVKKEYKEVDYSIRLREEIDNIIRQKENIERNILQIENKNKQLIDSSLTGILNENKLKEGKVEADLIIVKEESNKVDPNAITGDPVLDKEINETMPIRKLMDEKIELMKKYNQPTLDSLDKLIDEYNKVLEPDINGRNERQFEVLRRIAYLNTDITNLKESMKSLVNSMNYNSNKLDYLIKNKALMDSKEIKLNEVSDLLKSTEFFDKEDLTNFINKELGTLETISSKLENIQSIIDKDSSTNFYNFKDFELLESHFKKKIYYKKLFSTHDILSKQKLEDFLANKPKLFFYFEFTSGRRIGYYLDIKFPKKTIFNRSYKDPNSFIVFFNYKEFYPANPEGRMHFRTETDYLFLIGNTRNTDGIWFKIPEKLDTNYKINVGKFTPEYKCDHGSLFGNPIQDTVFSFEVYQFDFETDKSDK